MERVFEPAQVTFIEDPPRPVDPLPPPAPTFTQPTIDIGPPSELPTADDGDPGTALTVTPERPPVALPAPARAEPIRLVGKHQLPNSEDYYPTSLRRLGVEGATNVRVCVDEHGKRQGEPLCFGP